MMVSEEVERRGCEGKVASQAGDETIKGWLRFGLGATYILLEESDPTLLSLCRERGVNLAKIEGNFTDKWLRSARTWP